MTKLVLLTTLFITTCSLCQAQLEIKSGIKGGLLVSTLKGDREIDFITSSREELFDYKLGYQFGAFTQAVINEKFVLQSELLWERKGASDALANEVKTHLNFISLPVLVGYQPVKGLSILTGPSCSYFISNSLEGDAFLIDLDNALYSRLYWAINIGLEYQTNTGIGFAIHMV